MTSSARTELLTLEAILLLAPFFCGCASLDADNSASKPWNDPARYSAPEDWMMKPVFEPPAYGP